VLPQPLKNALLSLNLYGPAWRVYSRLTRASKRPSVLYQMKHYAQFLKPGDLCFDVGANIGRKSAIFLELGARVIAIEPQPENAQELAARVGGSPRIQIVNKGVGEHPGTATLHMNPEFGGAVSSFRPDWTAGSDRTVEVEITTLDQLIDTFGTPAFCKIDVEGYELEALRGLTRAIPVISIEYQASALERTLECVRYLSRFGNARVNFTPYDDSQFLFEEWTDLSRLEERLQEVLAETPWGDLFLDWRGELADGLDRA
jgi:FkbM family methyltransferase